MDERAKKLHGLIKSKGMNVKSFAVSIGLPPTTIYTITNGYRDIEGLSYRNFRAIAIGLGMTPDELDKYLYDE